MGKRIQSRSGRKPKATTSQVIGRTFALSDVPPKWRPYFRHLVQLREHFLQERGDLNQDALEDVPAFSTHMADAGTDTYDRDMALGLLSSEQDAMYQVEQALRRILDGKYGVCELTGKPIERQRLEVIPWTRFSAAAERKLEQEGGLKMARLGPRETVGRTSTGKEPEESE